MTKVRFNHMELTFPRGALTPEVRAEIRDFYGQVFGWEVSDVPLLNQQCLYLRVDEGQFILCAESDKPVSVPGYDHLGLLCETRAEVDAFLDAIRSWQERDDRVQIKTYEDLKTPTMTVHAFYVRHLLPIWFDVQVLERQPEADGAPGATAEPVVA
jgi:hypothetical protein